MNIQEIFRWNQNEFIESLKFFFLMKEPDFYIFTNESNHSKN